MYTCIITIVHVKYNVEVQMNYQKSGSFKELRSAAGPLSEWQMQRDIDVLNQKVGGYEGKLNDFSTIQPFNFSTDMNRSQLTARCSLKRIFAFTLTEVLITLIIIGIQIYIPVLHGL